MTGHTSCGASAAGRARDVPLIDPFGDVLTQALNTLLNWQQRVGQRRQLRGLDPYLLKDLGIDPADAHREASKPFWQD